MTEINGISLDWKAHEVVKQLQKQQPLTTGELRGLTQLDSDAIRYRLKKLERAGVVELDKDTSVENQMPPFRARITDEGEQLLEKVQFANFEDLNDMEAKVTMVNNKLDQVQSRLDTIEEEMGIGTDDDLPSVNGVRYVVATLENYLASKGLDLSGFTPENADTGPWARNPSESSANPGQDDDKEAVDSEEPVALGPGDADIQSDNASETESLTGDTVVFEDDS